MVQQVSSGLYHFMGANEGCIYHTVSTQRSVGIPELTQTEEQMHEKAAGFINRWRKISLHRPQPHHRFVCLFEQGE